MDDGIDETSVIEDTSARAEDSRCDELAAVQSSEDIPPPWVVIHASQSHPLGHQGELRPPVIMVYPESVNPEFTIMHEWAHVLDLECLSHADRIEWMEHRGFEPPRWRVGDYYQDPAEDWADSWAFCVTGEAGVRTTVGSNPTSEGCALARELISR